MPTKLHPVALDVLAMLRANRSPAEILELIEPLRTDRQLFAHLALLSLQLRSKGHMTLAADLTTLARFGLTTTVPKRPITGVQIRSAR